MASVESGVAERRLLADVQPNAKHLSKYAGKTLKKPCRHCGGALVYLGSTLAEDVHVFRCERRPTDPRHMRTVVCPGTARAGTGVIGMDGRRKATYNGAERALWTPHPEEGGE